MKFLVIDGLRSTRLNYIQYIENSYDNAQIFQCMSAEDAIFNVIDNEPDIIITSEILPFRNSFELARVLNKMDLKIPVIVLALDDSNALQAIKHNVFDYLILPLQPERLKQSLINARQYIDEQLHLKIGKKNKDNGHLKMRLSTTSGYKLIDLDTIAYFISDGSYSTIFFTNGQTDVSSYYLGKIEKNISDYHFLRISRSVIINLKKVSSIDRQKNSCSLELETGVKEFAMTKESLRKLELSHMI
ncbi:MAG: LytR/AlgR family response regulator transcription factor [Prolixibacteraceae bacterium]